MSQLQANVAVIGAGVVGSAIARELSKYDIDCVLLEKASDVCEGTSKANNGIIHAGYAAPHGALKAQLNVLGSMMYPTLVNDLDVPYKRVGSLVIAFTQEESNALYDLLENGRKNGVKELNILSPSQAMEMEPNLNPSVVAALYAPTGAVTSPYELTIALAENALANGVKVLLECEVTGIKAAMGKKPRPNDKSPEWDVVTNKGVIRCQIIINAAGLHADSIARMAGDTSFHINPRKGEYYILDKTCKDLVRHVVFPVGSRISKGITLTPTVDENVLLGPTADPVDDRDDVSTSRQGLDKVLIGARKLVPKTPKGETISQYAGLRATLQTEDFLIEASKRAPGLINVAGIQSPGLASAPAIAAKVSEMALNLLEKRGVELKFRKQWSPLRKRLPRFRDLSMEERARLLSQDPDWGTIICRCETVTKKEVLDAIRRPLGARTMDAVKRRTRAGMGRCQGGFCGPRIVAILAEELGTPERQVTKSGQDSNILWRRTKNPVGSGVDSRHSDQHLKIQGGMFAEDLRL